MRPRTLLLLFAASALWVLPSALPPHGGKSVLLAAEDAAGEGAHAPEGPIAWDRDLAIWSLITFLIFLLVLWKFAWGPLAAGLDRREQKIRQDILDAENARVRAEALLAEYEGKLEAATQEVREILAEARRDAEVARQNILGDAQRETEAMTQRSVTEIRRARDQALKELFDRMNQQVTEATEHVLGRALDDQDHRRMVEEALAQFRQQAS